MRSLVLLLLTLLRILLSRVVRGVFVGRGLLLSLVLLLITIVLLLLGRVIRDVFCMGGGLVVLLSSTHTRHQQHPDTLDEAVERLD